MNKIKILSSDVINQIAAGEIIENPASIIKELVENSIDAGSTNINIFIKEAGKTKIIIEDNGCGISKNDLLLAIQRHATSKLPNENLFNIQSYGFRGEALPSIAAISEMQIESRTNIETNLINNPFASELQDDYCHGPEDCTTEALIEDDCRQVSKDCTTEILIEKNQKINTEIVKCNEKKHNDIIKNSLSELVGNDDNTNATCISYSQENTLDTTQSSPEINNSSSLLNGKTKNQNANLNTQLESHIDDTIKDNKLSPNANVILGKDNPSCTGTNVILGKDNSLCTNTHIPSETIINNMPNAKKPNCDNYKSRNTLGTKSTSNCYGVKISFSQVGEIYKVLTSLPPDYHSFEVDVNKQTGGLLNEGKILSTNYQDIKLHTNINTDKCTRDNSDINDGIKGTKDNTHIKTKQIKNNTLIDNETKHHASNPTIYNKTRQTKNNIHIHNETKHSAGNTPMNNDTKDNTFINENNHNNMTTKFSNIENNAITDHSSVLTEIYSSPHFQVNSYKSDKHVNEDNKIISIGDNEDINTVNEAPNNKLKNDYYSDISAGDSIRNTNSSQFNIKDLSINSGTRIVITNLFGNQPVRFKFLKSNNIELASCLSVIDNFALAFPNITFNVRDDKKNLCFFPRATQKQRISQVIGDEIINRSIYIQEGNEYLKLTGYLCHPIDSKYTTNTQKIFINNRPVKDKIVSAAIKKAYKDLIPAGRHAMCVFFIQIKPFFIDINVSPTKSEIRFRDPIYVQDTLTKFILRNIIKFDQVVLNTEFYTSQRCHNTCENLFLTCRNTTKALSGNNELQNEINNCNSANYTNTFRNLLLDEDLHTSVSINNQSPTLKNKQYQHSNYLMNVSMNNKKNKDTTIVVNDPHIRNSDYLKNRHQLGNNTCQQESYEIITNKTTNQEPHERISNKAADNDVTNSVMTNCEPANSDLNIFDNENKSNNTTEFNDFDTWIPIGQLRNTYIVCKANQDLVIIDQHAVHEKITMEKLKLEISEKNKQYIMPVTLKLNKQQKLILNEIGRQLISCGFDISISSQSIKIKCIPQIMSIETAKIFLYDLIENEEIIHERTPLDTIRLKIANIACHNSIRAGRKLSIEEMQTIIQEMKRTFSIHQCNHHRPSFIKISGKTLDKIFQRT